MPRQTEGLLLGTDEIWATLGLPTTASLQASGGRSATGGPWKVGSVCSGMLTESFAFEQLPWKFQHVFWCEKDAVARQFIIDNFGHLGIFKLISNHRTNYGLQMHLWITDCVVDCATKDEALQVLTFQASWTS